MAALALRAVPAPLQPRPHRRAPSAAPPRSALPPLPDGPRRPDADVLLITIDALRADHVGAYGYTRATTPNIDALAARGVRFARAYAPGAAHVVLGGVDADGQVFPDAGAAGARASATSRSRPCCAPTAGGRRRSIRPAVFFVDAQKLKAYARRNFDFEYVKFEYIDAHKRGRSGARLLRRRQAAARRSCGSTSSSRTSPTSRTTASRSARGDIDRYDSEIAYTDAAVGRLIATVRKRRPGTIVVLAADHGEEFDEHGGRYHGSTLYDEQLRVPLIISIPGVAAARRRRAGRAHRRHADGAQPARHPGAGAHARHRPRPLAGAAARAAGAAAARLRRGRGQADGRAARRRSCCAICTGASAPTTIWPPIRASSTTWPRSGPSAPPRCAACSMTGSTATCGSSRCWRKGRRTRRAGPLPQGDRARAAGRSAGGARAGRAAGDADAPLAQRREAAELLVGAAAARARRRRRCRARRAIADRVIADWAAVGAARLGDAAARPRVQAIVARRATADASLRVRAALALAARRRRGAACPCWATRSITATTCCSAARIIVSLGKLRDRRAVPVLLEHLPEVQNRREMVDALGEIGDPAAARRAARAPARRRVRARCASRRRRRSPSWATRASPRWWTRPRARRRRRRSSPPPAPPPPPSAARPTSRGAARCVA